MKGFQFSLERVLGWRQMQQTMAEAELAKLLREQQAIQQARIELQTGRTREQSLVLRAPSTHGVEIARLDTFRIWTDREERRLAARSEELRKAVENQKRVVAEALRNVKMLERLRTRRQAEWSSAMDHEFETETGEFAVTQWRRRQAG